MNQKGYEIQKLEWESKKLNEIVFNVILHKELNENEWRMLLKKIRDGYLVYFKNSTNNRGNSELIVKLTTATLYDTNVVLKLKKMRFDSSHNSNKAPYKVEFMKNFNYDIDDLLEFQYSRFVKDKRLYICAGKDLYKDWITVSKNKNNKDYIFRTYNGNPVGFILFETNIDIANIELIAVKKSYSGKGIGTLLLNDLKEYAYQNNINEISVGTQISNTKALNLYIKNGFSIMNSIDIYHWWKN